MKPQLQIFRGRPDEGFFGDAWRTCIACVLHLDVEAVPFEPEDTIDAAWLRTAEWMAARAQTLISWPVKAKSLVAALEFAGSRAPGVHYIVTGRIPRVGPHSVVARDGLVAHNPSLDLSAPTRPSDGGYWWVTHIGNRL